MEIGRLRRSLLRWFSRVKRPLPWRQTRDPYAIWVSETMLQQTTVAAVIPYYSRFMVRFPNVEDLASASEEAVVAAWSGLGYYSRARNLRAGARFLVEEHGGVFPREVAAALELRGVGPYTASAVTSIAYGTRAAAVDGNVRRVLSRLHAIRNLSPRRANDLAAGLLSPRAPGAWNEAMMELGATICLPRRPLCRLCPISGECKGRDRAEEWGVLKPRRPGVRTLVEMALVERNMRVLLVLNPPGGLMGGLFELPHAGLPRPDSQGAGLREKYRGALLLEPQALTTVRHSVTHHRIEAAIYRGKTLRLPPAGPRFHARSTLRLLPLGGLTRKALAAAGIEIA